MAASERKKRHKRSRATIGNCKILAVNGKNYVFHQRFFSRNLFMWWHSNISSDRLLSKFFLSACKTVTFSARQSWHVLEPYSAGLHVPKKRFFLAVLFERFFFLLTQGEKRGFSQQKAFISR